MAFIEEVTKKAKDLAYVGANKARDAAEVAKINLNIAGEQREMDRLYKSIGQWFVEEYQGDLPDSVRELGEAVSACKARIDEMETSKNGTPVEEKADVTIDPQCPICGATCKGKFCQQCGAPMDI